MKPRRISTLAKAIAKNKKVEKAFKKTGAKMIKKYPAEKVKTYLEAYLKSQAKRSNLKGIAKVIADWGATKLSVTVAGAYAKAIEAPTSEIYGATDAVPLISEDNSRRMRGANNLTHATLHVVNLDTGQPPTRSNRAMSRLYGTTNKTYLDTIREGLDDNFRSSLVINCGFNQKTQTVFNSVTTGFTLGDFNTIFSIADDLPSVVRQQACYANVQRMKSEVRITNINKFLPVNLKVYLFQYRQEEVNYDLLIQNCVNTSLASQDIMAMPRVNQLTTLDSGGFRQSVRVDPLSNGIFSSPEWKAQCDIVHTVSKKLYAGDTLKFNHTHWCGPGLRIDKIYGAVRNTTTAQSKPVAYGMMFEMVGVPVEGYRADNSNIRYQGTGLGYLQYEFRKTMMGSNVPMRDNAADDVSPTYGGYNAGGFGVRVFTKEITKHLDVNSKIINFNASNVVPGPGGTMTQLVIPLMSDATPAGAGIIT